MALRSQILKHKKNILFIFFTLVAAGLIVIINFRFKYPAGGDSSIFLNPPSLWRWISSAWDENLNYSLGGQTMSKNLIIPFVLFFKIFSFFPLIVEQYLYFTLILAGSFLTNYYYFYCYIFRRGSAAFFSALIYVFNLFFFVSFLNYNIHLSFIILPLLFILCHAIVNFNYRRIIFWLILISCLLPAIFANPPATLPLFAVSFFYLIFLTIKERKIKEAKKFFATLLFAIILFVIFNFWWIYPWLDVIFFHKYVNIEEINATSLSIFETTSLREAFRFSGSWAFDSYYLNFKKGKFDMFYTGNPIFLYCTYLVIIFAYLPLVFAKKNKNILFFLGLSIFGLILAKGDLKPLDKLYSYVWEYAPGMFMFREPYTKFMLIYVFALSILSGYSILHYQKFKKIIYPLIFTAIFIPSIPFIIGGFISRNEAGPIKSTLVKVPAYLFDFERALAKEKIDYRVLSLPITSSHLYAWEHGFSISTDVLKFFMRKPLLIYGLEELPRFGTDLINNAYNTLIRAQNSQNPDAEDKEFMQFLSLLNVRLLAQENSTDWRWITRHEITKPPSEMSALLSRLEKKGFVTQDQTFGRFTKEYLSKIPNNIPEEWPPNRRLNPQEKEELSNAFYQELLNRPAIALYKVSDEFFLPKIYAAAKTYVVQNRDQIPLIFTQANYQTRSAIYLVNQNQGREKLLAAMQNISNLPSLEFKKISATKYRVHVHNAANDFPLVFNNAFHQSWNLYLQKNQSSPPNNNFVSENFFGTIQNDNLPDGKIYETWFRKPIFKKNQLMANGYANGWWINLDQIKKMGQYNSNEDSSIDFELVLEFQPEWLYFLATAISGIAVIGCALFILFDKIKRP